MSLQISLLYSLLFVSSSVFPCGDEMVAIIDDREDIWGRCANLVHVKPYVFFAGTADINAPPSSHRRNDSRKPQIPQSNSSHSRLEQRFVQTAPHEGKADNSVTASRQQQQ